MDHIGSHGCGQEYKRWLGVYTRHLAKESDEPRLREVCRDLLGPVRRRNLSFMGAAPAPNAAGPQVCGQDLGEP